MRKVLGILCLLVAGAAGAAAQDCFPYQNATHITGQVTVPGGIVALCAHGDHAYVATPTDLIVYDVFDPADPHAVGQVPLGVSPKHCVWIHDLVVVASTDGLVKAFDVSDPTAPVPGASLPTAGVVEGFAVAGDWLVAAAGEAGMFVFAIPDASNLTLQATVPTTYPAHGVGASGSTILVATDERMVRVSLAADGTPQYGGWFQPLANPPYQPEYEYLYYFDVAIVGTKAVIEMYEGTPHLPAPKDYDPWFAPDQVIVSDLAGGGSGDVFSVWPPYGGDGAGAPRDLAATDGNLALVLYGGGIYVFDIAAPLAQPRTLDPLFELMPAEHPSLSDMAVATHAYVISASDGILRTMPSGRPQGVPPVATFAPGEAVTLLNDAWAYSTSRFAPEDRQNTYSLWDLRDPPHPARVDSFVCDYEPNPDIYRKGITAVGDLVVVEDQDASGTRWILQDWSGAPAVETQIPVTVRGVGAIFGTWLVSNSGGDVQLTDISDPQAPVAHGIYSGIIGSADEFPLAMVSGRVVIYSPWFLTIVDFSDLDAPERVYYNAPGSYFSGAVVDGDILYLSEGYGILHTIDITQATGTFTNIGTNGTVVLQDDRLWIGRFDVTAVDVSDPAHPVAVTDPLPIPTYASGFQLGDGVLYACGAGVHAIDISDPQAPFWRGGGGPPAATLRRQGNWIVTPGAIYPPDCGEATAVSDAAPRRAGNLTAAPNPFNPRTTLRFELVKPAACDVAIYTLDGRRVRTLASGVMDTGSHALTWDGRDTRGRELAAGVYLARLHAADRTSTARLVLVR